MNDRSGLNLFNLFMTVLLALAAGAIGVFLVLATAGVFTPDAAFDGLFSEIIARLDDSDGAQSAINYVIGTALVVFAFLVIMVQVAVFTRTDRLIVIQDSSDGRVTVARESIRDLAERTMRADQSVVSCKCSLDESEEQLVISCRAGIAMGADIPRVAAEAKQRTKAAVENLLGVHVREVIVDGKYIGSRSGRLVAAE